MIMKVAGKPQKSFIRNVSNWIKKRQQKLEQKLKCMKHILKWNITSYYFWWTENFYERMKGKISNQEWKDLRTRQLYSRGDKSKKGI